MRSAILITMTLLASLSRADQITLTSTAPEGGIFGYLGVICTEDAECTPVQGEGVTVPFQIPNNIAQILSGMIVISCGTPSQPCIDAGDVTGGVFAFTVNGEPNNGPDLVWVPENFFNVTFQLDPVTLHTINESAGREWDANVFMNSAPLTRYYLSPLGYEGSELILQTTNVPEPGTGPTIAVAFLLLASRHRRTILGSIFRRIRAHPRDSM